MIILALDTTSEQGSLALLQGEQVLEERVLLAPDGFGHILFGEIEAMLARHGFRVAGVDLFAAAAGPGSFTGVRVGLTAVKGLAEACGKPAVAVSNLRALKAMGVEPVIDARRGEVYALREGVETVGKAGDGPIEFPRVALAAAIARIAAREGGGDPAGLDANYVRRSDAEQKWRDG